MEKEELIKLYEDLWSKIDKMYPKNSFMRPILITPIKQDINYLKHKDEIQFKHIARVSKNKEYDIEIDEYVIERMCRDYKEYKSKLDIDNQYYELFLDFENAVEQAIKEMNDKEKILLLCYFNNLTLDEMLPYLKVWKINLIISNKLLAYNMLNKIKKYM